MKLIELIRQATTALQAHGDMEIFVEVRGEKPDELGIEETECFQSTILIDKPWYFVLQTPKE